MREHSEKIRMFGAETNVVSEISLEPANRITILDRTDDAEITPRVPSHGFFDGLVPELVLCMEVIDDQGVWHTGGLGDAARAGAIEAEHREFGKGGPDDL